MREAETIFVCSAGKKHGNAFPLCFSKLNFGIGILSLLILGATRFAASGAENLSPAPMNIEPPNQTKPPVEDAASQMPAPTTPREFYNAGTELLKNGKLGQAEDYLERAVASQILQLQPPALYNLGQVRAAEGSDALKNGPDAQRTAMRGESAAVYANEASHEADQAISNHDLQKMIEAYVRGRGAHRELREAMKAVQNAMQTHGDVLSKWQRASGDFKSAVELEGTDTNAQFNADAMDKAIAKLVDKMNRMQQSAAMMAQAQKRLNEMMQKLQGMIPKDMMPPGAPGDDDDDMPFGFKKGMKEGPTREGQEMKLSREEAGRILDGFRLGENRHLSMGAEQAGKLEKRSGRDW